MTEPDAHQPQQSPQPGPQAATDPGPEAEGLNIPAGIAALLLPGVGQAVRGEPKRGLLAGVGVLLLFFGGMLIGGIDSIDSKEDRIWFFGQALVGPIAFVVDGVHQNAFKAFDEANPSGPRRSGRPDEHRVRDAAGRPVWAPLTREQIDSGMGPPNVKSVGRINEVGTLFCTIAGMLNLIVFLDALIPPVWRRGAGEAGGGA
ncbi:MAG: DUF6677 family protein [Planctomycetota bacterium]